MRHRPPLVTNIARPSPRQVPATERIVFITQWGWKRPHIFRPGLDVVVPPILTPSQLLEASPFLGGADVAVRASGYDRGAARLAAPEQPSFRYLLSFVGSVRLKNRGYSFGVRQKVRHDGQRRGLSLQLDAPTSNHAQVPSLV